MRSWEVGVGDSNGKKLEEIKEWEVSFLGNINRFDG